MVRFDDCAFDAANAVLRKGDRPVKLRPQALKILSMLVASRGELVTRDRIRQEVWGDDTFVDFNQGLNVCIRQIREALGDDPDAPRYIETVPKLGYRFIATVVTASTPGEVPASATAPVSTQALPSRDRVGIALGAAGVLVLAVALLLTGLARFRRAASDEPGPIRSIAVLPLANHSGTDQEFFADGMTDALITDLAQIRALKVISRTSVMGYKTARKPLPEIGRELGVDAVVEGSVQRVGDRVRVNVQLLRAATDEHVWAQTYERSVGDVLTLQRDLARAVAVAVRAALTPEERSRLSEVRTIDPAAYEAYAKGRYYRSLGTTSSRTRAREYFEDAVRLEPNWALAHVGVSELFIVFAIAGLAPPDQAYPQARISAERALQLDDRLGEPYVALAAVRSGYDWDWPGAEQYFTRALDHAPNYAQGHAWYAEYLAARGRLDEAVVEIRRALQLDPLSPVHHRTAAELLFLARDFDGVIRHCRSTLDLLPDLADMFRFLSMAHQAQGRPQEAASDAERAEALGKGAWRTAVWLAYLKAASGQRQQAEALVAALDKRSSSTGREPYELATLYAALRDRDRAMALLEQARASRYAWIQHVQIDPLLDPLRGDPRFEEFRQRIAREDGVGVAEK